MLRGWDYLIIEMAALLACAALIGLAAGWILWARRSSGSDTAEMAEMRELLKMRQTRIATLEDDLRTLRMNSADVNAGHATSTASRPDLTQFTRRPPALGVSNGLAPDDLTRIRGIDQETAAQLNELGVFHFHQVAIWTDAEVAWIAEELNADPEGRRWTEQAARLIEEAQSGPLSPLESD